MDVWTCVFLEKFRTMPSQKGEKITMSPTELVQKLAIRNRFTRFTLGLGDLGPQKNGMKHDETCELCS